MLVLLNDCRRRTAINWHEWCITYMSHVSYIWHTWVMSLTYDMHESCLLHMTYMSHVSYIWHTWVTSLTYDTHESCLIQEWQPWCAYFLLPRHTFSKVRSKVIWYRKNSRALTFQNFSHACMYMLSIVCYKVWHTWVMSLTYDIHESCLLHMTYMSHVSYIWHTWVMSLTYDIHESCLLHMTYMLQALSW